MRLFCTLAWALLLSDSALQAEGPKVACSFTIPGDWTRTLAGPEASVLTIAGPNTDLHSYQPSPADVRKLTESDLIIGIDPLVEPWLNEIIVSNNLINKTLWLGYPWISGAGRGPCPCGDPQHDHRQSGGLYSDDPHVWMDATLVEKMVDALAARLSQLPGLSKPSLEARRVGYVAAIRQVDQEAAGLFAAVPKARRVMITHHGNLGRLAKRHDIEVAGVILQASTTEAADPSARDLARLAEVVRTRNVRVLVHDRGQRAPAAFALARETGLQPPLELNVDSLDRPGTAGGDWVGMMHENARALSEAMNSR